MWAGKLTTTICWRNACGTTRSISIDQGVIMRPSTSRMKLSSCASTRTSTDICGRSKSSTLKIWRCARNWSSRRPSAISIRMTGSSIQRSASGTWRMAWFAFHSKRARPTRPKFLKTNWYRSTKPPSCRPSKNWARICSSSWTRGTRCRCCRTGTGWCTRDSWRRK